MHGPGPAGGSGPASGAGPAGWEYSLVGALTLTVLGRRGVIGGYSSGTRGVVADLEALQPKDELLVAVLCEPRLLLRSAAPVDGPAPAQSTPSGGGGQSTPDAGRECVCVCDACVCACVCVAW